MNHWSQPWITSLSAIALLISTGTPTRAATTPPVATPTITNPMELAQVSPCRRTKRIERVYTRPSLEANRVGTDLPANTLVQLAGRVNEPAYGWIRISAPVEGYIMATFLAPCGDTVTPGSGNCGIAQTPLAIHAGPSTESLVLGAVPLGRGFRLIGAAETQTTPPAQRGRRWVPMVRAGVTGWVAETSPGGIPGNVRRVSCTSIGL